MRTNSYITYQTKHISCFSTLFVYWFYCYMLSVIVMPASKKGSYITVFFPSTYTVGLDIPKGSTVDCELSLTLMWCCSVFLNYNLYWSAMLY